jgi:23S rRNA (cytidine1920-2'-O)/16S rRNA (cytidine1409-2'-O)-methyltransferase
MGRRRRVRLRKLRDELIRAHPSVKNPDALIARGAVVVDGRVVSNPGSLVREGAAIALRMEEPLRGEAKLRAALAAFEIPVEGRIALDVGAAAGGFTGVLLDAGARRVYAVDAGHGQLLGSLRQDPRVINLEATNLGALRSELVPDTISLITLDLSYLALSDAVPQLEAVRLAESADAVALVKPQFELGLPAPPEDAARLLEALGKARRGFLAAGWRVRGWIESPVRGRRGSVEFLLHAARGEVDLRSVRRACSMHVA